MEYTYLTPRQIVFGWGTRARLGELAAFLGKRVILLAGGRTLAPSGEIERLETSCRGLGLDVERWKAPNREPRVEDVDSLVDSIRGSARSFRETVVVAVGGGSAMDLGKAIAALLVQPEHVSVREYLEGVGTGRTLSVEPLPIIAMPTTAGTGAEATKNAVISNESPPFKKSLRSKGMMPSIAIVDPELTVSVPPEVTAATGMDALTQCLEAYISRRRAPLPRILAREGAGLALRHLERAVRDGASREAREGMSQSALLSGLALANSGLGLAHGVAAALGMFVNVPHGLACAVMLPAALRYNLECCEQDLSELADQLPEPPGRNLSPRQRAECLVESVEKLCESLGIPRSLSALGVRAEHIPDLVNGSRGNSLNGNPRDVSNDELKAVLESML